MKVCHAEEVSNLNNEQLDNLINALMREKSIRRAKKKEELMNAFQKAWIAVENAGYIIYECNEYENEDTPLNLEDIDIY